MTYKPHAYAMHTKTSEEKIHKNQYLQAKPIIDDDLDGNLCFPTLPLPYCTQNSKYATLL